MKIKKAFILFLILIIILSTIFIVYKNDNSFYNKYNVSKDNFIKLSNKELDERLNKTGIIYLYDKKENKSNIVKELNKLSKKNNISIYYTNKDNVKNNLKSYKILFIKNGKVEYKYKNINSKALEKNFNDLYEDICNEKIGC